jgi:hypothetical protein
MTRSIALLAATIAVASLTVLGAGCGGSTSGNKANPDGGGGSDASPDVSNHTEGGGGGGDGGLPEGAIGPQGTQLVPSSTASLVINGVTSDGYVVYTDVSAMTYSAVPLAGGTPTSIGGSDGTGEYTVGTVAFAFSNVDQNTGAGSLMIWTSAHGAQTIGTAVYATFAGQGQLDVSKDGTKLLYFDNTTAATVDATIINTDGTGKTVIAPGLNFASMTCIPNVYFAGDYAVVENCSEADGGVGSTLESFTGSGWTTTAMISSTVNGDVNAIVDPTGASVLYVSSSGLEVVPVATGTPVLIDATGTAGSFTNDGAHVVYATSGGAINLAAVTGGTPTTLLAAAGYQGVAAVSPDNSHLLAFKSIEQDMSGDVLSDLYLGSATAAGSATSLVSQPTAGLLGDVFTTDSTHVTYMAALASGAGNFTAAAISGGTPVTVGMNNSLNLSTSAAKALFNANLNSSGGTGGFGAADMMSVDLSAATPAPTLLVSQADAYFYLDQAKDKVAYSWSYLANSQAGIWVLPVP